MYFGYGSTRRYYRTFYLCKSTRRYYRTDSLYRGTRRYYWTYPCIKELILVVRILYWYYGAYSCTSDLIRSLFLYKVLVGTTQIHYTEVPVGTTGLILILPIRKYSWVLQNLYLYYRYRSTRGYYRTCTYITDTEVLVGATELVLILPIRKYP